MPKIPSAKRKIYGLNDVLTFGKHKDKVVRDAMCDDPRWFDWAVEENVIELNNDAYKELANQLDLIDDDLDGCFADDEHDMKGDYQDIH